jgi:hypothetical protein
MRRRNESVLNEVLPPEERVIEAVVARYQRVAPAVTRFARAIAGNPELQVRLGSAAKAGDGEIILDPGVFQAAYSRNAPVTPTEVALTSALHEAVHLIATNFEEKRPLPASWLAHRRPAGAGAGSKKETPIATPLDLFSDEFADDVAEELIKIAAEEAEQLEAAEVAQGEGVAMSLLDALREAGGEAAEALFMGLEDGRQEARHLAAFGGARSVLADMYVAALPDALRDAKPLGQFALSCFMLTGGYVDREQLERSAAPSAAAALNDAGPFLDAVQATDDPWDVGTIALQLLEIARLHALVSESGGSDSPTRRKLMDEADKAAIAESVDAVRIVTPPLQDREAYDNTRQAAQTVSAEQGRHGEAEMAGDPATEQIVRVSESPTVYLPTGQGGKLIVGEIPFRFGEFAADGRTLLDDAARRWHVAQRRVSGELYPLFLANQRRGLRSGYDAGDLSPYAALLLGAGVYERMFERRDLPMRRSYAVSLLVDGSASMLQPRAVTGGRKAPWALAAATLGAWTLAHLCDELQIEFEVALFNRAFAAAPDDSERTFSDRRHRATGALRRSQGGSAERLTRTVNHYLVKPFDRRWRGADDVTAGLFWTAAAPAEAGRKARLHPETAPPVSMFDKAANVDEFNLAYAAGRLASRRVATRILVVLADGMTRGSVQALADSVEAIEQAGTVVLGIGIGDTTVQAAYARNQVVEQPDELARAMVDGVRSTLYRTLFTMGGHGWWSHPERVSRMGAAATDPAVL